MTRAPCIDAVAAGAAVPDGRTDNAASLNAFLDAAPPGATICFPAGTYAWSGALRLRRGGLRLEFEGATFVPARGARSAFVLVGSARATVAGIAVRGLQLDYTDSDARGAAISAYVSESLVLEDLAVFGAGGAALSIEGDGANPTRAVVRNVYVVDAAGHGVTTAGGVRGAVLDNVQVRGANRSELGASIYLRGVDVVATRSIVRDARDNGVRIEGTRCAVELTRVEGFVTDAFRLAGADARAIGCSAYLHHGSGAGNGVRIRGADNCQVRGGTFERCVSGIHVDAGGERQPVNASIAGVVCRENDRYGILVDAGERHTLDGNILRNNGVGIQGLPPAHDVVVRGNHCYDDLPQHRQAFGIRVAQGCTGWAVTGNISRDAEHGERGIDVPPDGNVVAANAV